MLLDKEIIPYDWSSEANIWMTNLQGGDILSHKSIFSIISILAKLLHAEKPSIFDTELTLST